ncbi:MAG: hypothetical protein WKG06_22125 [Segetibacter sp.]
MWEKIIDSALFTLIYPISLIVAVLSGHFIAKRFYIGKKKQWIPSGIESSVIAIFGLLLSFTFLSSNNSMKDRLRILQETSNAAENLRTQSSFMNDTIGKRTNKYLSDYLNIMSDFKNRYQDNKFKMVKEVEILNNNYLIEMKKQAGVSEINKREALSIIPYFNALNNYAYSILVSFDNRTPKIIIILLIVTSWLIGVLAGFLNGFNMHRHFLVPVIFVFVVSMCMQIIRDLDNPFSGNIQPGFSDLKYQYNSLIKNKP